ncbi:MAG: putative transport system permease protein [Pseudonocardiales bacterium]|nr:putative transport system permease protein [Pseudonocardiales bacterium]
MTDTLAKPLSRRPMRTVSLRNLRAHKVRLALTVISVLLGTAFVAGSFVFTDTLKKSFDTIFASSDEGLDVRVTDYGDYSTGVPLSLLPVLQKVPGVRAVEPQIDSDVVLVDDSGKKVSTGGAPSVGGAWVANGRIRDVPKLVDGRAPQHPGEVVVNDGAAKKYHLSAGERIRVVVPNEAVTDATVVGIYRVSFDTGGYLGALFSRDQAMSLFTDGSHYTAVDMAAESGVSEKTLAARVEKVLPAGLEAKTGTQVRDDNSAGVSEALGFITYILLGFGIVALLVGTFIIYNTFSMIVAQRQRELALLRAIGADRRQVRRSVVFEAFVIGVIGSLLGLAGGLGLAYGLHALLDSLDMGLPSGGLVLTARTVVISVLLGTIVTVFAASAPARRAGRIAPVAAMREEFASASAASLRRRTAIGIVVGAAAAVAAVAGALADKTSSAASLTGLGLVGVCAAAMLLSPVFARWVIYPLGRVVGRPFGMVGQLARTNAVRNPRRTAATAFALTLGLVLVTGIAVVGASMKASINKMFSENVSADYVLSTDAGVAVPVAAAQAARTVPGVQSVTEIHELLAKVDGKARWGAAIDGPLGSVLRVRMEEGAIDTSGRKMIVSRKIATERHWTVGTRHTFAVPGVTAMTLTVTGIYKNDDLLGPWAVSGDIYRALTPKNEWSDDVALVRAAGGTDLGAIRAGLEKATNDFYVVDVRNRTEFKGMVAGQIDGLIALLYGLLGLAIVIAILGVINTQALSVIERRREIGMLRAVGMQRKQVRRMVYVESLLIAVFGATLGVGVGLAFGSLFARTLRGAGMSTLSVPWGQAVLFLVLAAAVGVLAALWPGFRAARTPPLSAIAGA